jgi:hypothetical protein
MQQQREPPMLTCYGKRPALPLSACEVTVEGMTRARAWQKKTIPFRLQRDGYRGRDWEFRAGGSSCGPRMPGRQLFPRFLKPCNMGQEA